MRGWSVFVSRSRPPLPCGLPPPAFGEVEPGGLLTLVPVIVAGVLRPPVVLGRFGTNAPSPRCWGKASPVFRNDVERRPASCEADVFRKAKLFVNGVSHGAVRALAQVARRPVAGLGESRPHATGDSCSGCVLASCVQLLGHHILGG